MARRMVEAKLDPKGVEYVFLTHLHSDHTVDLAHLIISGWVMGRTRQLRVIGPTGTEEFVKRVLHAFEFDLAARRFAERYTPEILDVPVREVGHGDIIEGDGWQARAIEVDHVVVKPALGFEFRDDNRRAVISGDTAPCDALVEAALGADLLIHELNSATPDRDPHNPAAQALPPWDLGRNSSHTCPHQVGSIATRAAVPKLVLSHLPPGADEGWILETIAPDYRGQVIVGQDLMQV
jgi:ribonuclease Z